LPLTDDREALARSLWLATNAGYSTALDNYLRVKTEAEVRAKEGDTSPDFSQEVPQTHLGKPAPPIVVDRAAWEQRVRALSSIFREYPDVNQNIVILTVQNETDYYASSESSQVVAPHMQARLVAVAVTRADDGMDLFRVRTFEAETVACLRSRRWKQQCANLARAWRRCARHRSPSPSTGRQSSQAGPRQSFSMKYWATGSKASASAATRKARPSPKS
jgi:hypothetical protein